MIIAPIAPAAGRRRPRYRYHTIVEMLSAVHIYVTVDVVHRRAQYSMGH